MVEDIETLLNRLRIIPRILITLYGILFYKISVWFMALPDPTATQAAFISTIVGAAAAFFGLYINSGGKKE